MEIQEVKHYQINGRYRIKIERAASAKGVDGFTVETNADSLEECQQDTQKLYDYACSITKPNAKIGAIPEVK